MFPISNLNISLAFWVDLKPHYTTLMQTLRLPLMMKLEFDLLLSVKLLCSEKIFDFHQDQSEHDDHLICSGLDLGSVI